MIKYLLGILFLSCITLSAVSQIKHTKQSNVSGSDIVADAPWRMKKTDALGNINSIPLHIFIKDADSVNPVNRN